MMAKRINLRFILAHGLWLMAHIFVPMLNLA